MSRRTASHRPRTWVAMERMLGADRLAPQQQQVDQQGAAAQETPPVVRIAGLTKVEAEELLDQLEVRGIREAKVEVDEAGFTVVFPAGGPAASPGQQIPVPGPHFSKR